MTDVQIFIECDEPHRSRARYTIETLFSLLDVKAIFLKTQGEIRETLPVLVYRSEPISATRQLFIPLDPTAQDFFKGTQQKRKEEAKEIFLNGMTCFSLFNRMHIGDYQTEGHVVTVEGDLISTAFYSLSLFEEHVCRERDQFDRFQASSSIYASLNAIDRPIVAEIAFLLGDALSRYIFQPVTSKKFLDQRFAVCLTHDIDYISKFSPGIAYRELVQHFLRNANQKNIRQRWLRLVDFMKSMNPSHDPYKISLNKFMELENSYGIHATYFFKAGGNDKRDITYSLRNPFVRSAISRLTSAGHQIGLHPSFNTYLDKAMWKKEMGKLNTISLNIISSRQHYLRLRLPETFRLIDEMGIRTESTLGFAERHGFRNGMCHPFHPYDLERERTFRFLEFPLHVMDGTLATYQGLDPESAFQEIIRTQNTVASYGGVFTILFHNTCYDRNDFPGWSDVFENYLQQLRLQKAFVGTLQEVAAIWE